MFTSSHQTIVFRFNKSKLKLTGLVWVKATDSNTLVLWVFLYYLHHHIHLHLAKYFTWIWPREWWQQYLNYLKNISIHELFIRGREDQTLYQESPARNFDMRRLWRHFRPMNFPNINWNKFSSQCYISTAVWLALLFLYFHKLNCGEVNQLFPFHSIFCLGWLDLIFTLCCQPIHD